MVRRQFLWIDPRGAGVNFLAPSNVSIGAGSRGTLAIWQWPVAEYGNYDTSWRVEINSTNYMRQYQGRSLQVCSQGVSKYVTLSRYISAYAWDHLVYTWDFPASGTGQIAAFWNGVQVGATVTDVAAPVGTPTKLYLGPLLSQDTKGPTCINSLAIWNQVASAAQVTSLYRQGHRYRVLEADGPGTLTFCHDFDGRYSARVAAGDPTLRVDGSGDRYALVDDGVRQRGRKVFLLGNPRHDLSLDDRVPLCVPCPVTLDYGRSAYVRDTNNTSYSELQVLAGYASDRRLGACIGTRPIFDDEGVPSPSTYRQRIYMPNDDNPKGRTIRIGPIDYVHQPTKSTSVFDQWGSGRSFSVVSDAGNTVSRFKTSLDDRYDTGFWVGADLTVLSGTCAGRRLRVTAYDKTTKVVTIEGALPSVPEAGTVCVVDLRARLQGCRSWGSTTHGQRLPEMNMDAWLWEFHNGVSLFTELEFQFSQNNTADLLAPNMLRYDRGRTALMDGAEHSVYDNGATYGRPSRWDDSTLTCKIQLERIEVDGPSAYQSLTRSPGGAGPDYADNFMLAAGTGESTKVWRNVQCQRAKTKPTKCPSASLVRADLQVSGTWRNTYVGMPVPVEFDEATKEVVAALVGVDPQGVQRIGYIRGTWDAGVSRIRWVDEPAPTGRSNPFIVMSELRTGPYRDAQLNESSLTAIVQNPDGTWSLVYVAQPGHPDHYMTYMLCGASDRWSFTVADHWWSGNPIAPITGGPDRLSPQGNGFGQWANRDAEWHITQNPYATDPSERYWGYGRGKSVNHRAYNYGVDLRPVIGIRGADLRSMAPLPHGNAISPLAGPLVHQGECAVLGQADCLGLYTDTAIAASSGIYCYISEDGVHFQKFANDTDWIPRSELSGEPSRLYPGRPFRVGDVRVYFHEGISWTNLAWCRLEGEAWYELAATATEGMVETPAMSRPAMGWGGATVNAAPNGGSVRVEVVDADTDTVVAGFGKDDFEPMADSVGHSCRWAGYGLDHLTAETIRLRFYLTRPGVAATTPRLYAWRVLESATAKRPAVSDLRVAGQSDPAGITDPAPEFGWVYSDAGGFPQNGFHLIVASSHEALQANTGDVWDTGQLSSSATSVTYAGATLESESVYYWKVRVRNTLGVWSEEW